MGLQARRHAGDRLAGRSPRSSERRADRRVARDLQRPGAVRIRVRRGFGRSMPPPRRDIRDGRGRRQGRSARDRPLRTRLRHERRARVRLRRADARVRARRSEGRGPGGGSLRSRVRRGLDDRLLQSRDHVREGPRGSPRPREGRRPVRLGVLRGGQAGVLEPRRSGLRASWTDTDRSAERARPRQYPDSLGPRQTPAKRSKPRTCPRG